MKKNSLLLLLASVCTMSSIAVSAKQQKDTKEKQENEAIRSVVLQSLFSIGEEGIRATTALPSLKLSLHAKGSPASTFRDKEDLESHLKAIREEKQRRGEPRYYGGPDNLDLPSPRISQITITKPTPTIAYFAYTLSYVPETTKLPSLKLLAVLRKEDAGWKVVFHAVP